MDGAPAPFTSAQIFVGCASRDTLADQMKTFASYEEADAYYDDVAKRLSVTTPGKTVTANILTVTVPVPVAKPGRVRVEDFIKAMRNEAKNLVGIVAMVIGYMTMIGLIVDMIRAI